MPFPNFHAARQNDPKKYTKLRQSHPEGFPEGVMVVYGILMKGGKSVSEIQSIRFDRDKFTSKQAKEWLKEHKFKTGIEQAKEKSIADEWSEEEWESEVQLANSQSIIDGLGVFDVSDIWCSAGLDFDDNKRIIFNAVLGTEGWSTHGWGFTSEWANSVVPKIGLRPKMYNGHELDPQKMASRPLTEWVATAKNARTDVGKNKFDGCAQVIADLQFAETDVGEQIWKAARSQPEQTHLSIHSRNRYQKDYDFRGKKGNVCLECLNHISTDFVSYGALNGGVSIPNSVLEQYPGYVQNALSDSSSGIYLIYDNPLAKEIVADRIIANDYQKKTKEKGNYRKTDDSAQYCENCRFFQPSWELKQAERPQPQDKIGSCSLIEGSISPRGYTSDFFEPVEDPTLDTNNPANSGDKNNSHQKENSMKYEFDTVEQALANADVKAAIEAGLPKQKVKVQDKDFTVEELVVALQTVTSECDEYKKKEEMAVKQVAQTEIFNSLVKEHKLPAEAISDDFKAECIACADKDAMEKKVKDRIDLMKSVAEKMNSLVIEKPDEGKKGADDEFFQSLVGSSQNANNGKVSDDDFWKSKVGDSK